MTYSVVDLFVFIVRRWWKMLIVLAVFGAIGVGLAFLLPEKYSSEVKLLPTAQETGLMGVISGLQSQLGLSGLSIPGSESGEFLLYGEILRSNTVLDYVIDSTSLIERMDLADREEARSELLSMSAFVLLPEQIFVIEVKGKDGELVSDIANNFAKGLDHFLTHSSMTRGRNLRKFVEGRLEEVRVDLKAAQDSLTEFQSKHKIPPIDPQVGANLSAYTDLITQAVQKELELEYMKSFSTYQNPQYEAVRNELDIIQRKLASLPPLTSRYLELYRDLTVQQEVYILLVQQYEQAKLMEVKDTPLVSVMEWAEVPKEPYFPPKKLVVVALLVIGLVFIIAYSLIRVYWEHVVSNPESHTKWTHFRNELKKSFSKRRR